MATISKLVVSLSANSAKLVKNLQKSRKSINKWAKDAGAKVKAVGKIFGALGVVALGGFLVAINKTAASIDKLTKAAGKFNMPVEDFQKFAHIASLSNIETDNFAKSIQRMLKTVGDARDGLSTATKAFDQLGLNWDELAQKSPVQQFELIAKAISGIPTQADKVKVAMDIFGRSGADLLNVFASDIRAIGKEFDDLDLGVTQQQANMVAKFQDSKTVLSSIFESFTQNVTAEVAPALTLIVKKITAFIKKAGGVRVVAKDFAVSIVKGIGGAIKGFGELIKRIDKLRIFFIDAEAAYLSLKGALLSEITLDGITFPKAIKKELDDLAGQRAAINLSIGNKSTLQKGIDELVKEIELTFNQKADPTAKIKKDADSAAAKINGLGAAAGKAAQKLGKGKKELGAPGDRSINDQLYIMQNLDKYIKGTLEGAGKFGAKAGLGVSNLVIDGNKGQDSANIAATTASSQKTAEAVTQMAQKDNAKTSLGQLTINMITDTGKVAGEIFGEPSFLTSLKTFVDRQTNDAARAGAGG